MKPMYPIPKYQAHIVIIVAGAYVVVQAAGMALCRETKEAGENYPGKCYSAAPFCNAPNEFTIPLAYVTTGTSGDSVTGGTLSFAPQVIGDAETLTFQLV